MKTVIEDFDLIFYLSINFLFWQFKNSFGLPFSHFGS